jgi:BlaR1 peptidase M56
VAKARHIWWLHAGIAALGLAVTALALGAAAQAVRWELPTAGEFAEACRAMTFPSLTPGAVLTLALGSVAFAVIGLGLRSAVRQIRASRSAVRHLRPTAQIGCGDTTALVFEHARPQAFCVGLLRPRIFISSGALSRLDANELEAVVAHEAHHARAHDPLRVAFARVLGDALFFLPALRQLGDRYASLAELAADEAAVSASGNDPRPLAGALLTFDGSSVPAGVGIAPERVDQLLGERPSWELPVALLAWAAIVLTALTVVALRAQEAMARAPLDLPAFAAHACMLVMVLGPLAFGALALLAGRRWLRGQSPER